MSKITISLSAMLTVGFVFALPVLGMSNLRATYVNELALRRANWSAPQIAFTGDSLTVGGTPWGLKLGKDPFSVVTQAKSGFTAWQLIPVVKSAVKLKPKIIVLTIGTNDVGFRHYNETESVQDIMGLVGIAKASGARVLVTLTPPPVDVERARRTRQLVSRLRPLLQGKNIETIDLWPLLAPQGVLLNKYSADGIHLTPEAYVVWSREINKIL